MSSAITLVFIVMLKKTLNILKQHKYASAILFLIFLVLFLSVLNNKFKRKETLTSKSSQDYPKESSTDSYSYNTFSKEEPLGQTVFEFRRFSKLMDVSKELTISDVESDLVSTQAVVYSFNRSTVPQVAKLLGLSNYYEPGENLVEGTISLNEERFVLKYIKLLNSFYKDSFIIVPLETVYLAGLNQPEPEITTKEKAEAIRRFYILMFRGYPVFMSKGSFALVSVYYLVSSPNKITVQVPNFLPEALNRGTTIGVSPGKYNFSPIYAFDSKFISLYLNNQIDVAPEAFVIEGFPSTTLVYILDYKKGMLVPIPAQYLEYKGKNNSLLDDKRVIFVLNE